MSLDEERLRSLLGAAELANLRRRLRARYERGISQDEFTLTDLEVTERRALAGLLGRPTSAAESMRLRRSELDGALSRAGIANTLHEALEFLDGPLLDRKADRRTREQAWSALLETVDHPRLRALVLEPSGSSLLKRLANGDAPRGAELLERARRVLERLPERGVPLAHLAARELGDAHALDAGRPVATLVLRACGLEEAPNPKERSRDQWARLGITVNELAAPALCLNLPARAETPGARLARVAAAAAEPFHLTLRTLLRDPPEWDICGQRVFICENPAILAIAADRLGTTCAPLVCTQGMPAAAQQTLLRQLAGQGARLFYHGDFDWPGLLIGNFVMRELNALPWRFTRSDYEAAYSKTGRALSVTERVDAAWDGQLAIAMATQLRAVHEEAVVESLLMDLAGVADADREWHELR
jgi:uncharacterized protein (TIGR02679 family)